MTHHIAKYGDIDNWGQFYYITIIDLKCCGDMGRSKQIIGEIPDFTVLNVHLVQPRHNSVR